jgi:hypothetical protein
MKKSDALANLNMLRLPMLVSSMSAGEQIVVVV